MLTSLADDPAGGLRWSACVRDAASGAVLASYEGDRVLPAASVGKMLLLVELARRFAAGDAARDAPVRRGTERVADSGLWQVMDAASLTASDAARLVGAVSDNLATNVLLDLVGLDAVARTAASLGLTHTVLLDRVRDERGPKHPPVLSRGSATELSALAASLHRGEAVDAGVSGEVVSWLALGADLSMVAGAFGLDPLAHRESDRGIVLWNKTGTDSGVRADVGVVTAGSDALAYAVLAQWQDGAAPATRDEVLAAMRAIGASVRARLAGSSLHRGSDAGRGGA
ncbi:serine hydrolase [Microbacterium sp. SSM24]|uniref:serine hydrolase n=1 Tax=Microbacterium sp. SSM24 TaxID=2991714 RepID=UPI002226EF26|nr:serine hydrolase [Microbacterium sp. SSM24]MCW3491807.1 class A beta-lactamase-related serine hydrolase [Microbacterium sp. SSM24]